MPKTTGTAASSREKAFAYLRENILVDPARQGSFLNEQELAAEIGVSRTPVREALLLLVADGLVELIPQRGAYVPAVTGRQISELMELRGVLERHAAAHTIGAGTVPGDAMASTLQEQAALPDSLDEDSAREFIRLDAAFHQLLVDAVGNELISRTYAKLHVRQVLVGVEALFRTSGRRRQVCGEHQEILGALLAGDAGAAQEAISRHLDVTLGLLLRG